MAVMTGELTDAGQASLSGLLPRMFWILNRMTIHEGVVVVDHPVEANINGTKFSINVEPTHAGEFYRIEVHYFDPSGTLRHVRELERNIEVPEEGGDMSGNLAVGISPDRVYVGLEPPEQPFPFWLEASIGDPDPGSSTGSGDLYVRRG